MPRPAASISPSCGRATTSARPVRGCSRRSNSTPWARAPGTPYLLQALIAAEHAVAPSAADTNWPRIARRYGELEDITGSPVVRLNRAVAVAETEGPLAGLALLDGLDLSGHRLPAVRGQLLLRLGRDEEARAELLRALDACGNEAERAGLRRLLDATTSTSG